MTRSKLSELLASEVEFPESARPLVEGVLQKDAALRPFLAENPSLSVESWWRLYKPSLKKAVAENLVIRPLTREQRVHVLQVEKRSTLVEGMVSTNVLDEEEQQLVLTSPGFSASVAAELLSQEWCSKALRRELAFAAGGQVQLDWLASSSEEECPDDEATRLLADFSTWGPQLDENGPRGKKARSRALSALLHRRPSLLPAAVASGQHPAVVMAAVGCRHLVDEDLQVRALGFVPDGPLPSEARASELQYTYMALVNNPPTSPVVVAEVIRLAREHGLPKLLDSARSRQAKHPLPLLTPYEEVEDAEGLRRIANRALPSEYRPEGRPFDVLALAMNPHLDGRLAARVANALDVVEGLSLAEVAAARSAVGANHPEAVPTWWAEVDEYAANRDAEPVRIGRNHHWDRGEVESYSVTDLSSVQVHSLVWDRCIARVAEPVAEVLGESQGAWEAFFTLVDEFDGSLLDLVNMCRVI